MTRSRPAARTAGVRPRTESARETTVRRLAWAGFLIVTLMYVFAFGVRFAVSGQPSLVAGQKMPPLPSDLLFSIMTFSFPLVAILILARLPRNTIGWILMSIGFAWALSGVLDSTAVYALTTGDRHLAALADALSGWLWAPAVGLMGTFLILLFPDGRVPSRPWRFVGWLSALALVVTSLALIFGPGEMEGVTTLVNPLGIESLGPLLGIFTLFIILIPLCVVASAVSLIQRFRRARGSERLQLKWVTAAVALVALLYLVAMLASLNAPWGGQEEVPLFTSIAQNLASLSFFLIPVSIGIAILKHRLFDIDVVINKALVYGSLAAFITAVYVAIVAGVGTALGSGEKPNLALSIVATAVVAVAFQPVRERVQRLANRLVYGKRATPYEVLSRFSETVASSYGAEELLPYTAETLREATGAAQACVWMRTGDDLVPVATAPRGREGLDPSSLTSDDDLPPLPGDGKAPIFHQGELLGALTITKVAGETVTPADQELLDNLASQAGQVLRNARLTADLQARLEEVAQQAHAIRLSRQRIVAAQDEERRGLERNIHDGAQQHLVALAVKLRLVKTLAGRDPVKASVMLGQLREEVGDTLTALRELASGIYPAVLEEQGVAAALEAQVRHSPIPTLVDANSLGRYPLESEATVYFCCLEALQNVAKYAAAKHAWVTLRERDGALAFSVRDDGRGFDPDATTFGSGLRNITDRIEAARGSVEIISSPGAGTTITGRIPAPRVEMAL